MGRARSSSQTRSPVTRLQYALVEPFYTAPNAGRSPEKVNILQGNIHNKMLQCFISGTLSFERMGLLKLTSFLFQQAHEHTTAQRQAIGSTVFVGAADIFAAAHSTLQLLSVHSVASPSGSNLHEQAALDLAIAGLEAAGALFRCAASISTC